MGKNTKIEWTHHTFNPWTGCTKVSAGCDNCYAERMSKRNPSALGIWGQDGDRKITSDANWRQPLAWNKKASAAGERHRVFCASMADVFEDRPELVGPRRRLFDLIENTPELDWLLLTKRPQNILPILCWVAANQGLASDFADQWRSGRETPNVWIGTSVENQAAADERIPHLLRVPAAVRFLSCEPLLGPVDLVSAYKASFGDWFLSDDERLNACPRSVDTCPSDGEHNCSNCGGTGDEPTRRIHWLISGGESGPGARPSHPDWHRSLRDQCAAAGVPFFFKQWGEWAPMAWEDNPRDAVHVDAAERRGVYINRDFSTHKPATPGWQGIARVGKAAAGRLLDGCEWNQFPEFKK